MSYIEEAKQRIVQELVPGKQITLAHMIANPDPSLYEQLGITMKLERSKSAIGILTITPPETAIIIADIAIKTSGVNLGFVDRVNGSLIISGTVYEVNEAIDEIVTYGSNEWGYLVFKLINT